ncbi:ABC transporter permease [Haloquadratum walsbyi]|jgi:ABC-type transport system, involved in lipoprotein release, permease component|uniref:ABC-type transport system, involved in lipoprotein release, permease component n=1 Tax=Haloquadratum walsbyi J07HQW2 TaxID=1238425 RepID=U1PWT3_9EURY|nr:ABC transporter permease [Haloquadratum walsbyi]ERG96881.1 MAG: ABC-type transport system, involved in lipoprotein release, permease component [Haloquadratum walsbyi J07HQW2]
MIDLGDIFRRFPSVKMAWRNLGRNRVRTGLATLGIVIGVIAIASLGMAGAALQQQAQSNLGSLTNEVAVSSGQDSTEDGVTTDQVEQMRDIIADAEVVPQKTNQTTVTSRDGQEVFVTVVGVSKASALYETTAGSAPTRLQNGALLSVETARELGLEIGDPVAYDGSLYRLRGFLEAEDGFGGGGSELVLPLSALSEQEHYDSVTVVAGSGEAATAVANTLEVEFNEQGRDSEEILGVRSFASTQESINSFLGTLNLALLGIGSISLIVASVAILNVMLMSTIERRGEIGVLRAVGIRRGEVLRMILAEAMFLGLIGGIVGATASLGAGYAMFQILASDGMLVFTWAGLQHLFSGFAFAVVASVLSGVYPAWKAANDSPVAALRG